MNLLDYMVDLINSYIIPNWFIGFGILMDILFAIVSIAVAIFAYKIYKVSKEESVKKFSIGFLFISISYLFLSLTSLFLINQLTGDDRVLNFATLQTTGLIGLFLYMIFFIAGLVTIFYANIKSNKTESYFLMLILGILAVFTNINDIAAFHITSSFLLLFINYHYFKEYVINKNKKTLLVFIAFIFLLLSHFVFIFPVTYEEYVIAHVLELVSYSLILFSLIKSMKNPYKRKITV